MKELQLLLITSADRIVVIYKVVHMGEVDGERGTMSLVTSISETVQASEQCAVCAEPSKGCKTASLPTQALHGHIM